MNESVTQSTPTSNKEFLQAVFGQYYEAAYVTGFAEDPAQLDTLGLRHYWGGGIYQLVAPEYPAHNNFFVISTFHPDPDDGKFHRRKDNFAATFCIMVDDVGTGPGAKISDLDMMAYPLPSWKLQTSPGNYQYGYIFDQPVMDAALVNALLDGLVDLGLVEDGTDPGMKGVTRYARLPLGSNTKAKYGGFRCSLDDWHPERKYNPHQLATGFGVDIQSYYREESIREPIDPDSDIVLQSIKRLGLYKGVLRGARGIYDMRCPWIDEHSDRADSGAAYMSPMGFKCHHGHCATRTGRDLLNYLHGADPEYVKACEVKIPFEPVKSDAEATFPEPQNQEINFLESMTAALHKCNPNDPDSLDEVYTLMAQNHHDMTHTQFEHWVHQIKKETQFGVKAIRGDIKAKREQLMRENRQGKGILHEPAWKEFDGDKPLAHFDNFEAICQFHGITIRYNLMRHVADVEIPNVNFGDEEADNLNLIYMRDLCHKYGIGRPEVGDWMLRLAQKHAYHPFVDYLDSLPGRVPYDPMSPNLEKVLATLSIDEHEAESVDLIRRWLISLVAAVRGHQGAGMKGVLVFSGPQSIGKTSWFRNLLPDASMFLEGLTLDAHNKDSMINATDHLLCELGELDSTLRREMSALKAFLSSQTDKIRHPYAKKTSQQKRRTVFCGTVNDDQFLVDLTGNARFWPVAVTACDWTALQAMWIDGTMDAMWHEIDAQYHACIEGRDEFRWWISPSEAGVFSAIAEQFIQQSPGETLLRQYFDIDGPAVQQLTNDDVLEVVGIRPKDQYYHARSREVFQTIKRLGFKSWRGMKDGKRARGYVLPRTLTATLQAVNAAPFQPTLEVVNNQESVSEYDFL